ncbi:hypothetical protein P171DRAFT_431600, partial [Karstenula rhodostoma CBS 690.94]
MSRRQVNGYRNESPEPPVYDDAHRAFLQAFFSHSVFTIDKLRPVVAAILSAQDPERPRLEGDITEPMIMSLVQNTNAKISHFDFEIHSARDQTKGDRTFALVNTTSDTFTQLATAFTPDEIAYIKRLLDAMFEENNSRTREIMAVKQMRANQLAKAPARNRQSQAATQLDADADEPTQVESNIKSINHGECQRVLQMLVSQGFFQLSSHHYYSLAPRGLLELRNYLKETYNELPAEDDDEESEPIVRIRDCEGCQEIVTIGLRCDNRDCGVRWHTRCANQFFGRQGSARRCPKCKTAWTGTTYVGEKADRVQPRSSTAGRSSRAQHNEDD